MPSKAVQLGLVWACNDSGVPQEGGRWSQWTIPAKRVKAKREHRVLLCRRAAEILKAARTFGDRKPLVFLMRTGKPISMSTLPKMLRYFRVATMVHGFRSILCGRAVKETNHPARGPFD